MDREEFTSFYTAAFHRLVGQLYAMTGDQAEAQDAVQEAFVRAWARHGKLDRDGSPESWIRVTAWRIAASRWRRSRDRSRLLQLAARPESIAGPTPDRVAFVEALRKVPAEQRRALVLHHRDRRPDRHGDQAMTVSLASLNSAPVITSGLVLNR